MNTDITDTFLEELGFKSENDDGYSVNWYLKINNRIVNIEECIDKKGNTIFIEDLSSKQLNNQIDILNLLNESKNKCNHFSNLFFKII